MPSNYITVTQLTRYIKFKIDNDEHLNQVLLKGEISNFKAHTRGHYYFTIKDETSRINAVMFQTQASKLKFMPNDGMKVMISGKISIYEATGGYQIYVNDMIEDGIGNLYVAYEQLKKKLELEGLFDQSKKRPIPKFPKKIGIVTAPTGAAIRDMLSTIKRRWPITETILFPSLVQGALAAPEIVKQIERAQGYDLDVLIVGRGGGSIEDMWCFNDEEVARAISRSRIPIISAVGHEVDFTISDFVADLRAPTPTGAAEMAVPNQIDFYRYLQQISLRLNKTIKHQIVQKKDRCKKVTESYILKNPLHLYQMKEQKFDQLLEKLQWSILSIISTQKERLDSVSQSYIFKNSSHLYENKKTKYTNIMLDLNRNIQKKIENSENTYIRVISKLEALNPLQTIKRGYAIPRLNKKVIMSSKKIKKDDLIDIEISDGVIHTIVL